MPYLFHKFPLDPFFQSDLFSSSSTYRLISINRINSPISPLESSSWKLLWKLKLNARVLILFL
jgi:hypothetical protein